MIFKFVFTSFVIFAVIFRKGWTVRNHRSIHPNSFFEKHYIRSTNKKADVRFGFWFRLVSGSSQGTLYHSGQLSNKCLTICSKDIFNFVYTQTQSELGHQIRHNLETFFKWNTEIKALKSFSLSLVICISPALFLPSGPVTIFK